MPLNRFSVPLDVLKRRLRLLGCPLDPLTMQESLGIIRQAIAKRESLQHVVVNVAKLINLQKDADLYADVSGSDLINIDGMGVVWGARLLGHHIPERVSGIDLMEHILALCAKEGYRPYILGAKPEVLEQAIHNIQLEFPTLKIAGSQHGYYGWDNEPTIIEQICMAKPDCLFVAISSPHKERIMSTYKDSLDIPFIMGVGGSIDIMAGFTNRAPQWMQRTGLEWVYRIYQEPKRMWKRYALTNTLFAWLLLKTLLGKYSPPPHIAR